MQHSELHAKQMMLQNAFFPIAKCVFVQIAKCFFQIAKCICPNCQMYLNKFIQHSAGVLDESHATTRPKVTRQTLQAMLN